MRNVSELLGVGFVCCHFDQTAVVVFDYLPQGCLQEMMIYQSIIITEPIYNALLYSGIFVAVK